MEEDSLLAKTHHLITEIICSDTEECCIVLKRIVDLEPGNSPRHHDICRSMCLREHVLDLLTRPHVPVRYSVGCHLSLPILPFVTFALGNYSLTNLLHDVEGKSGIKSHVYQINHDIITAADSCRYSTLARLDEFLRIAQPYIGSMCQTCYSHKIWETCRLCIYKHLHGKVSSELWYTQTSKRYSVDILRGDTQRLRAVE